MRTNAGYVLLFLFFIFSILSGELLNILTFIYAGACFIIFLGAIFYLLTK